mmetsp:Transcript_76610/g.212856  ORF Transcript_76610/g.212856 Transcript_76610/m.212856 type:complete len:518 (-) Transcript_76610:246-1799(-)
MAMPTAVPTPAIALSLCDNPSVNKRMKKNRRTVFEAANPMPKTTPISTLSMLMHLVSGTPKALTTTRHVASGVRAACCQAVTKHQLFSSQLVMWRPGCGRRTVRPLRSFTHTGVQHLRRILADLWLRNTQEFLSSAAAERHGGHPSDAIFGCTSRATLEVCAQLAARGYGPTDPAAQRHVFLCLGVLLRATEEAQPEGGLPRFFFETLVNQRRDRTVAPDQPGVEPRLQTPQTVFRPAKGSARLFELGLRLQGSYDLCGFHTGGLRYHRGLLVAGWRGRLDQDWRGWHRLGLLGLHPLRVLGNLWRILAVRRDRTCRRLGLNCLRSDRGLFHGGGLRRCRRRWRSRPCNLRSGPALLQHALQSGQLVRFETLSLRAPGFSALVEMSQQLLLPCHAHLPRLQLGSLIFPIRTPLLLTGIHAQRWLAAIDADLFVAAIAAIADPVANARVVNVSGLAANIRAKKKQASFFARSSGRNSGYNCTAAITSASRGAWLVAPIKTVAEIVVHSVEPQRGAKFV